MFNILEDYNEDNFCELISLFSNKDEQYYDEIKSQNGREFQENYNLNNNSIYELIFRNNTSEKTYFKNTSVKNELTANSIEISENKEEEKHKKEEDEKVYLTKERDENMPPIQYTYEKIIKNIFPRMQIDKDIKDGFKKTFLILELEKKMSDETFKAPKKRNRDKQPEINEELKKLGRKKKLDSSFSKHNKDSEDNIIKKIKSKLVFYLLKFINSILNENLDENKIIRYIKFMKNIKFDKEIEKEDLIKDLDYKIIVDKMKKEINLEYLAMPLKRFLSFDISPKFSTYPRDSNKKIIDHIIENEKDNEIISFVLNDLTFGDWFDIFIYKKELKEIKCNLNEKIINKIMNKFIRADEFLKEIYRLNNGDNYFSCFISILYNYKRWFFIKLERKRTDKIYEER